MPNFSVTRSAFHRAWKVQDARAIGGAPLFVGTFDECQSYCDLNDHERGYCDSLPTQERKQQFIAASVRMFQRVSEGV